jgi:glycosyltransferase involved in cell wall biosynthesis
MNLFLFSMGLGVYSVQLAKALGLSDRVVIALNEQDEHSLRAEHPTFFEYIPFKTMPVPHYGFPDPRKFYQILRIFLKVVRHKPEVIHVLLSGLYPESFLALWLATRIGLPLVVTVHDTQFHPGDSARLHTVWLHCKVLELCSQIIVHGKYLAEDLIHWLGMDERIINIVPHGNYDIYLQTSGLSRICDPKPGQVLMFGRMKRYKGLDVLIQAASIVARHIPKLKIILAGQGPELDLLESTLKGSSIFEIRNRYIPAREVTELFSSSTLVVIPYKEASQSGPLHLAYSMGRPVVATRVGAIPESLQHGREGFLVPPNDPTSLAQAMIKILNDHQLAVKMGLAARLKADIELNWVDGIGSKTRAVYQKAIEIKKKKLSYPGIGAKARWKRVRNYYYQVLRDEHGRQKNFS